MAPNDDHPARPATTLPAAPPTTPAPTPAAATAAPARNPISPKKLLLSKWTAVSPRHKERHFIVTRVLLPEPPAVRIEQVELEAVHSKRSMVLHWRALADAAVWRRGWV